MQNVTHSLLKRQLRKFFTDAARLPEELLPFIRSVDEAYRNFDEDRTMLERSLDLSSQELLQANAEMRAVFRLFPDLFFRLKRDGVILDCNTGKMGYLSVGPGDVIGKKIQTVSTPEVGEIFDEALRRININEKALVLEYSLDTRGCERFYEASLLPIAGHQVIVFVRDISARKSAESERNRLFTAIEQASESIAITDANGIIQYVNPAYQRITGFAREEAIGQSPRVLRPDFQGSEFHSAIWEKLKNGQIWRGRFLDRKKDDAACQLESAISPVRDGLGGITNYVVVSHDVTREEQLEMQLRQSQKMEAIGRLAGGIAHDFNNLLTAIIGNAELALSRLSPSDPLQDDVGEIKKASVRAASLTSQLLAFGRRQVLHPRAINLNDVIEEMGRMLNRVLGENILFTTRAAPGLWPVRADPVQMEQVIMNLCVNARDAMPDGGSLSISTENLVHDSSSGNAPADMPAGEYVAVRVTDTGIGMDEATHGHLFEPFFTTKELGKGTGLGLATVYGIVKQSGGHIVAESAPGSGSKFTIYLPKSSESVAVERTKVSTAAKVTGAETVLLVEDEEQVRKLTHTLLQRHGYKILAASHAAEAMELAGKFDGKIDLMLTDVVMPGMSGDELAHGMAALRPAMKVLFMSGHPETAIAFMGEYANGRRFLKKPFTSADLARKVREALDEK